MEKELHTSANHYDKKVEVSPISLYVFVYDKLAQCVYSLRKVLKLLRYRPEEIAALPDEKLLALLHPDDRQRLTQYLFDFAHAEDNEVREFEYRVLRPNGGWNWFYSRDQVIARDQLGAVRQIAGVVLDLTAEHNRANALRASEEFNRSILESSADCIKLLDLDGKLLSMNPPGLRLMEIDDFTPFSQKTWAEIWPEEEGKLAAEAVMKAREGETAHFRGNCTTAKGNQKWWDVIVSPVLNAEGKPERLVSVSRDITQYRAAERALVESEKKLRMATIGGQLGLWFWNLERDELGWTEVGKKLFGVRLETEFTYAAFLETIHPSDRPAVEAAVYDALENKREYNMEYRIIWPDQSVHWIAARGRGFYNEAGQPVQMMGTVRDVTPRKRAEQERELLLAQERELRAQAEQANRIKEEFLSVVSHELRTPLNHMYGWIKMLRLGHLSPDETAHALETIERNAVAQNRLIEDLLDLSRVITGKLKLDIRNFAPSTVIRAAIDAVRPAAEAKGIQLVVDVPETSGILAGDPDRLQQVVWNLVSNAIKFTLSGGRVSVHLAHQEDEFVITVSDNGQGIEPEFLPHVFDRFRQADGSITRRQSGLGLGLAIVRHLVESHGGTVKAHSAGLGKGASFQVRLPALKRQVEKFSIPQPADKDRAEDVNIDWKSLPTLQGLRILAVDDEPDARQLVSSLLRLAGAEVRTANDIQEAKAFLSDWPPDLLVSDIGMPDGSGYELIRLIRQHESHTGKRLPAVALTAYNRPEDRLFALNAGFQMYVSKPVEPAELIAVIASLGGRFH